MHAIDLVEGHIGALLPARRVCHPNTFIQGPPLRTVLAIDEWGLERLQCCQLRGHRESSYRENVSVSLLSGSRLPI